jgi:hypothetical protein
MVTASAGAVVLLRRVGAQSEQLGVIHDLVNSDMTIALQDALTAKRLLRYNLSSTMALKEAQSLEVTTEEREALVTVDAEIAERETALESRIHQQATMIMDKANNK